jgi:hypothetical protein
MYGPNDADFKSNLSVMAGTTDGYTEAHEKTADLCSGVDTTSAHFQHMQSQDTIEKRKISHLMTSPTRTLDQLQVHVRVSEQSDQILDVTRSQLQSYTQPTGQADEQPNPGNARRQSTTPPQTHRTKPHNIHPPP